MGMIVSMYDENKGTQKRKRRSEPYTKGEINKLIDSLCHPLGKKDKTFLVFDGDLARHGSAEPAGKHRKIHQIQSAFDNKAKGER
jgi:hypothetical protein